MPDIDHFVEQAYASNPIREPILRSAIRSLQFPLGSRGLDAGCGIGLQALLLAETVGPEGHITGLDLSPEALVYARDIAKKASLSERITFQQGDISNLPFENDIFDWAWSVDCVGYAPIEPLPLVKELARVVKPGGSVIVLVWSCERLLPGYPVLEAHLDATSAGIAPFVRGNKPDSHFLRALAWFRDAGLEARTARTFVGDAYAPLTDDLRSALIALFQMRWSGVKQELGQEDWACYQRLCLPESPDFILDRPDYYAFFTYSIFCGTVPA